MTEPTAGAPTPPEPSAIPPEPPAPSAQPPVPPAAAPSPPPASSWQAPAPSTQFQAAAVPAGPAPGVVYADTIQRVIAYIIDVIVFFIVGVVILGALIAVLLSGSDLLVTLATVVLAVLAVVGSAIYFVWCWMNLRASIGQRVLGLETVNAADGATLTRDQAIRRWAFLFGPAALGAALGYAPGTLAVLGSLVGLLAFIYELYLLYSVTQSPKRQGYHDVQANTVVVKRVG